MSDRQMTIWHAADAPEPVRFAAGELASYLGRMTGRSVGVAEASGDGWSALELRAGAAGQVPGSTGLAEALARQVKPVPEHYAVAPGADAFLWRTGGGTAAIVGTNPRSTLYGVYDLLEERGCRFYGASDEDEIVPRLSGDPFAEMGERFEQATFPFRERHFLEWVDAEVTRRDIAQAAKQRMNGFSFHIEDFAPDPASWKVVLEDLIPEVARRGLMPGLGEHGGYVLWLPPERYAAEHPEWYAQIDGRRVGTFRDQKGRYQFCTENPAAMATFLDNMIAFLREHPLIQIMHIAPEDAGRWCECELCAPIPIADRYLKIDSAIADRIHEVRPDIWVTHLVYANHAELPTAGKPSSSLNVSFVPFGRDYTYQFTDPRANMLFSGHPWSLELIESWARLCAEVGAGFIEHTKAFRNRWITFRLLPLPHLKADLTWWRNLGAGGFNAPQEGEGWWVKHLNSYVYGRLIWDLDASPDALVDDYFARYWGELAGPVREVCQAIADALPNLSYSRNQPALLPNRTPIVRTPPPEQWAPDAAYLERAIEQITVAGRRAAALRASGAPDSPLARRLAKLNDAIEGALAGLAVSLGIRRYLLARGTPGAAAAAADARAAHDRFAALQTPERLTAGTLWTGAWRRDQSFAEWEREANATAGAR